MNDDMERRLRELFEDKATESAAASRAPEPVVKRARRRQLGTIAVSVVTVIALAGVSFAGIRTLNGTGERGLMPADISPYDSGRYPVFERTAQIESLSVTSPSDWYLVNQWPLGSQIATQTAYSCTATLGPSRRVPAAPTVPAVRTGQRFYGPSGSDGNSICTSSPSPEVEIGALPLLQLSNRDLGLTMPACGLGGTPPMTMTGDDAVMEVVIDYQALSGGSLSDTVSRDEALTIDGSGEPDEDLCGGGYYRKFVAGGIPYVAWASFGPDVTDEDRAVALNALTLANEGFIGASGYAIAFAGLRARGHRWRAARTHALEPRRRQRRPRVGERGPVEAARPAPATSRCPLFPSRTAASERLCARRRGHRTRGRRHAIPVRGGHQRSHRRGAATHRRQRSCARHAGAPAAELDELPVRPVLPRRGGAQRQDRGHRAALAVRAPSDPTATPIPSSSPEARLRGAHSPAWRDHDRRSSLGLHWTASSKEENGEACIYLTIDDIPESEQVCGDPSKPVLGVQQV